MLIRCRIVPSDASSRSDCSPERSGPYGSSTLAVRTNDVVESTSATTTVQVPVALVAGGTVADLEAFIAGTLSIASTAPLGLSIGGFTLPCSESLSGMIREGDELSVRILQPDANSLPRNRYEQCTVAKYGLHRVGKDKQLAMEAYVWKTRAKELALLAEERAAGVMMLENRIEELTQQLSMAVAAQAASPTRVTGLAQVADERDARILTLAKENAELSRRLSTASASQAVSETRATDLIRAAEKQSARIARLESGKEALMQQLSAAVSVQVVSPTLKPSIVGQETQSVAPLVSTAKVSTVKPRHVDRRVSELVVGDAVRYRLQLVDAWSGRPLTSGWRSAAVAKLVLHDPDDPVVVLRHRDGALDCVEASRLLELKAACFGPK